MLIVDTITLDPAAFLPGGAELDLSGAGFRVLEADFGDADVELQMARAALGEIPTDYHPPNTVTTLKLGVRQEGEVDLPTAAHMLAQKVGEINEPGTEHWLQRDFDYKGGGEFAGPLGKRVYKATLQGLGSWQRGASPDVVLTLITGPYWYADVEAESAVFESAEGARELIATIAETLGTAPGLIRYRITNLGEADLRGLILASECRDHPQDESADTTAAPAYAASDLTLKGGSEVKEVEGVEVVEHDELTAGWLTILDSEHGEHGHLTHKGVRRLWLRAEDPEEAKDPEEPGEVVDNVQLKLRCRPLGSLQWSENSVVTIPSFVAYQWLDMGEARPAQAALGDERWQFQVQARALHGAGKVRIHRVAPLPTEQYIVLKAPDVSQGADAQEQKSPGVASNVAGIEEGAGEEKEWSNPTNVFASDNTRATKKLTFPQSTKILKATKFLFAVPEAATIRGVVVEVERSASRSGVVDWDVRLFKAELPIGENKRAEGSHWPTSDQYKSYGGSADLWGTTLTPADVNAEGFGAGIQAQTLEASGFEEYELKIDHIRITVYYTEAADENRVCFSTRSIELRSDGVFRQHPEDDVWGQLVPEGFLPYASPSGLEGRESRFIVVPTSGDLGTLPDGGDNPVSAQAFTRAAYHVAREAA